jgi:hypothetical protein
MNRSIADLWSRTALVLWPEDLVLASVPLSNLPALLHDVAPHLVGFSAIVVERDEVSVTIARTTWSSLPIAKRSTAVAGPYRAITFDLPIDLGVTGYLLPAAERLAAAGVSIVVQATFQKDHLLVRASDAAKTLEVLGRLVEDARSLESAAPGAARN